MRWGVLLCCLCLSSLALADEPLPESPLPSRADAGSPDPGPPPLSEEDRELIAHLELLESLEDAADLELLLELSEGEPR